MELTTFGGKELAKGGLRRRNAFAQDMPRFPAPSDVTVDSVRLPELLNIWSCAERNIQVYQRVYGAFWYSSMTVFLPPDRDKDRDLLIDITREILPADLVAMEGYPAVGRPVRGDCHQLWAGPGQNAKTWSLLYRQLLPKLKPAALGLKLAQDQDNHALAMIGANGRRDWTAVQRIKNQRIGETRSCFDVLLPESRGAGACLFYEIEPSNCIP
ncbi:MAG: hypothetical protein E6Q76_14450 [Rhizobium sp.]|nr:MAG: hypothetical protein E6Q76_14450 [Rhizobium sp.]